MKISKQFETKYICGCDFSSHEPDGCVVTIFKITDGKTEVIGIKSSN